MRKLRHREIPRPSPQELEGLPRHPVSVVVDNVRSIYNVGSLFRTSDAACIEHLYLTGITGTPDHRQLHKTALGAQDTVPWSHHDDPVPLLEALRGEGYTVVALEITDSPSTASDLVLDNFPLCLVVGNELHGVDEKVVALCDRAIEIDQFGSKQSLNVAVAYGVGVFDVVRRYRHLRADAD